MAKYEFDSIGYDSAEELHNDEQKFNVQISEIENTNSPAAKTAVLVGEAKNIEAWALANGYEGLSDGDKIA